MKGTASSKLEADPFDIRGIVWEDEEEACRRYLTQSSKGAIQRADMASIVEDAAACVFEYLREAVLTGQANVFALDRFPFLELTELWPKKKGRPFPGTPWTRLNEEKRRFAVALFRNGYDEPPSLTQPIVLLYASRVFENFIAAADNLIDDPERLQKDGLFPSVPANIFDGAGEHVVFTIDYRESPERLKSAFDQFLQSRSEEFKKHQRKLTGAFYRHRLKDIALLRLWRRHGKKILEQNEVPGNESSCSEAKTRARWFTKILMGTSFSNIRNLERDVSAEWKRRFG